MCEKLDIKLMFSSDGEKFTELKELNGLNTNRIVEPPPQDDLKSIGMGGKMTFSHKLNPLELMGIIIGKQELIRYCQSVKSNNWLKIHGLPMRRKKR